jgi:ABC-type transport system involved in multi-copper enzyme maturation permease subunit
MSAVTSRLWYSGKLMLSGYGYGALALLTLMLVLIANVESWEIGTADADTVTAVLTIGLPLFLIALFSNLFGEELEERAFGLLFSYPSRAYRLLLERIALALVIGAIALGLCLLVVHFTLFRLHADELWTIGKRVVPVCAFLSGLSLLASLVGRNVLAGIGIGIGYWMAELTTRGAWTGDLHLFQGIWPTRQVALHINGALLLLAATGWLAGCLLLMTVGKRKLLKDHD